MATTSSDASARVVEERVCVAVGREFEESKLTLLWTLRNFGARLCLLYVHNPRNGLSRYRFQSEIEEDLEIDEILEEYIRICEQENQVPAEKLWIKMEDIGKGIVKLVEQHAVTRLVMGAAADKHYTERMDELKSSKAIYINQSAHPACHIWFICKGHLIQSRKGNVNTVDFDLVSPLPLTRFTAEAGQSDTNSPTPSIHSGSLSSDIEDDLAPVRHERGEQSQQRSESNSAPLYEAAHRDLSPSNLEGGYDEDVYMQLERSMLEAADAKREALDEMIRRQNAKRDAIDAVRRAKTFETLHAKEVRRSKELEKRLVEERKRREELEEALAKEEENLQMARNCQEEELSTSIDDRIMMESQMAHQLVEELKEKVLSIEEVLSVYKAERDELRLLLDNALKVNEDLLTNQGEPSRSDRQHLCEFSFEEIQEATDNFDPSLKIEEGDYGSIYKGVLRQTQVIIKMLHSGSSSGPSQYHQEVEIAGKLRHPNLVTLIGVCPEAWTLIYEYLPNGSLEDQLCCSGNSTPLSWQTRLRICIEICGALIFLHSDCPNGIVHGDLKTGNVLLDANYVSKLSGFGVHSALSHPEILSETDQEAEMALSVARQDLSFESDVYSFGMLLLNMLTGRSSTTLAEEMRDALDEGDEGSITSLLEPSAGDWPSVLATQLAHLALSCCDMDPSNRPDLRSEVWVLLEPMKFACEASPEIQSNTEDREQIPQSFICPIYHEVMQDPHVAADGFTYEGDAIREWINTSHRNNGHVTSPMTNASLGHLNLVPNLTLRSVIQEWIQRN